ncbi:YopX family protein [Paraliobacillus ryukyuensis]|uniref:YopX family protein n=1 Tax=Paraliobacillus ryukyuensis TaxID=200904 RepID=UPI0009A712B7|nr:YopX family protein [Paraliobacillus ryukyuensis]
MREIKFRGKSKMTISDLDNEHFEHDNGWFVGNLIQNGSKPYVVGDLVETDPEYIVHEFWMPVVPESVGQCTGLKDKNGTEIYESDIGWDDHNEIYGVVKFDEGKFVYEWDNICEDLSEVHQEIEIVGNDNYEDDNS